MQQIRTIKVPRGIQYLSQVEEIKTEFNNDLPHNVVINKQVTGCGGTSLALMNDEKYIVAVHLIEMIKCKVNQKSKYPNLLGVYNETTDEEIIEYLKNGGKKIMVTYDSVPRLKRLMGDSMNDFRLLVDEFHKLIAYLGNFKPEVAVKLLERSNDFKSMSYLTATPTDYRYLPQPMKDLDIVEFDWEAKVTPKIKHCFVKEAMGSKVLATILDIYDNSTDEIYVYYNSRSAVAGLIKKIIKCKPELKIKDFNVMFAQTSENTNYFKKHFRGFEFGVAPDGKCNKRLNFISSMGFEGLDFYPNEITNALPVTLVVSDPKLKSMRYDINVELVQIFGRFRKHQKSDSFVKNEMIYLWNTQNSEFSQSEEDYYKYVTSEKESAIDLIESIEENKSAKKFIAKALTNNQHDYLILTDNTAIVHPYSVEAQMSAYTAIHSQSSVLNNLDKDGNVLYDSEIVSNLSNLDPELSNFSIPDVAAKYKNILGRIPSVNSLMLEYNDLQELCSETLGSKEYSKSEKKMEEFLQDNSEFNEWIAAGVTTAMMGTLQYKRERISQKAYELRTIGDNENKILKELNLEVGEVYLRDEIIQRITEVYQKLNISTEKVKATEIKKWYEIKNNPKSVNGKNVSAYKIVSKL